MVYVNEVTSIFRNKQYSLYAVRIQIPRWSTKTKAPQLQQETIFSLCRTYTNSEMVYVNKGTSLLQEIIFTYAGRITFRDGLRKQRHITSAGNNIHLMHYVSKFRDGLRKQRHLKFRRKQYLPHAGRIQIPRWYM